MAYVTPTTVLTNDLIAAGDWNKNTVDNPIALRTGEIALTSQAVGDLVIATSATQLGRVADVAVGQVLVSGGVTTAPAYSASPSITALTYTTSLKSTTALATPGALSATQATEFASTVSGAAIMGFGTTNDVSLMNRAGTVVLGVGPNTTTVNIPGTLAVTGAVTGGTYNGQTISSAASFTGTVATVGAITAGGTIQTLGTLQSSSGADLTLNANGVNRDVYIKVNGTTLLSAIGSTGGVTVAGLLTVSGFGTSSFSAGGTGAQLLRVENTTSGATNSARFELAAGTVSAFIGTFSQGYTTGNFDVQSSVALWNSSAGGISLAALHASGAIRFYSGGSTERAQFSSSGQFIATININAPGIALGANANASLFSPSSAGGSSTTMYIGNATINVTSDRRLKQDITSTVIDAGLLLSHLSVVDYRWNDPSDNSFNNRNARGRWTGLIAQDTIDVMPWVVNAPRKESDLSIDYDSPEPWHIEFQHIVPVLVKGWQQHDATISQLAARIAALETKDH